ncbi:MAG: hypothetical protein KAI02_06295, partial [Gammaproteobacteria bacterium]|nr:hypothetical protein [Gammaproteobacteria bacterium]
MAQKDWIKIIKKFHKKDETFITNFLNAKDSFVQVKIIQLFFMYSDYKADKENRKFIHTHHINGDKNNNHADHLQVLCIKCHAHVDRYHTRLKSS